MTTGEILAANDVNPGSVHYVAIPFADMPAALKADRVQAIYEVEPYLTGAENTLGAEAALDASMSPGPTAGLPLAGYITTWAWAHRYSRTAAAFARAINAASGRADDDRMAVQQALISYLHISRVTVAVMSLDHFPTGCPTRCRSSGSPTRCSRPGCSRSGLRPRP